MFDFDNIPDRRDTWALKQIKYDAKDIIPMWVADMDYACFEGIRTAICQRAEHPVYGYTVSGELSNIICRRMENLYGWKISPDWIVYSAGLIQGLNFSCKSFCEPGDAVAIMPPIYPPFLKGPPFNGCKLVKSGIVWNYSGYEINLDDLNKKLAGNTKLLLFCNPHNPTGRCFTEKELRELGKCCIDNDVIICSDEIHCELTLDGNKHIPIASLDEEIASRTITLMSPSKTFGIAGLMTGFAIIPNQEIRAKYANAKEQMASHPNIFGLTATKAAYKDGEPWRKELLEYLTANRNLITNELSAYNILCQEPQATYLYWLDCTRLNTENPHAYFEKFGVGLSDGAEFDRPGFLRLNFATSRQRLMQALGRMQIALDNL